MEKTVKIEEYNPDWVSEFHQEKARIMEVLKNNSLCVEHIGSTSVMGLGGKIKMWLPYKKRNKTNEM